MSVKHDIDEKTGEQLEKLLLHLVKEEWNVSEHQFLIKDKIYFNIEPNPTPDQPGNGCAKFLCEENSLLACRWDDLLCEVEKSSFSKKRTGDNGFLNTELVEQPCGKWLAANILMSFEIARREPSERYPVTREETIEAINIVMNASENSYPNQVNIAQCNNLTALTRGNPIEIRREEDTDKFVTQKLHCFALPSIYPSCVLDFYRQDILNSILA